MSACLLHFTCTCILVVSKNDAGSACNNCTYAVWSQYGRCWTAPDLATAYTLMCTFPVLTTFRNLTVLIAFRNFTVLITFRNLTLHNTAHRLRVESVCGQWELSEAAKRHTPKQFSTKLWPTNMSNKPSAFCPHSRGWENWRTKTGSFSSNLLI